MLCCMRGTSISAQGVSRSARRFMGLGLAVTPAAGEEHPSHDERRL
jgi:hypothetical protein